jgi:aspartyl-tRNA(Asn)/glutamyl-tRNA(Gln) amidotransferase subunit B
MSDYTPTIGLEIHAELKTKTKLFCNSLNDTDETRPNTNVCPVCLAHPGTLPVLNHKTIGHILRIGTAVGGSLADYSEFDRKNYFYPDIPKGYQISQYTYPLVSGGELSSVAITRIHLEEDTARSTHATGKTGGSSSIDFNRAGVPLMELVTEPVIHTPEAAVRFARELQLLLRYLGASDANMEKGEMRVEANVSISNQEGTYGTKVEVKNLNSFRSVERAIQYEIKRQQESLVGGRAVIQETRGWDEARLVTYSQRLKEESHDYRYFPDPDVTKFKRTELPEFAESVLQKSLPELPWDRRDRYQKTYGLPEREAEIYVRNLSYGEFFEAVAAKLGEDKQKVRLASNYVVSDLAGLLGGADITQDHIQPQSFAQIIELVAKDTLSSRGAKDLLAHMVKHGGDPGQLAQERGLIQESDRERLRAVAEAVIREHRSVADEYRSGKESSLQYLVGQGMKATGGAANPKLLQELIKEQL